LVWNLTRSLFFCTLWSSAPDVSGVPTKFEGGEANATADMMPVAAAARTNARCVGEKVGKMKPPCFSHLPRRL
jgi:hypothetical protein